MPAQIDGGPMTSPCVFEIPLLETPPAQHWHRRHPSHSAVPRVAAVRVLTVSSTTPTGRGHSARHRLLSERPEFPINNAPGGSRTRCLRVGGAKVSPLSTCDSVSTSHRWLPGGQCYGSGSLFRFELQPIPASAAVWLPPELGVGARGETVKYGAIMNEQALSLMVIAHMERDGYTDVPPPLITPELEQILLEHGFLVSISDGTWVDGRRLFSPRAVRAGHYRSYIPPSNFTRVAPPGVRIPAIDEIENIDGSSELLIEALLKMRGAPRGN